MKVETKKKKKSFPSYSKLGTPIQSNPAKLGKGEVPERRNKKKKRTIIPTRAGRHRNHQQEKKRTREEGE